MNIASIQLSEFLGEYLRLLRKEQEALKDLQKRRRRGVDVFDAWQRLLFLEVEIQLAFERIEEVLEKTELNPHINEKCRQIVLSAPGEPEEVISASLDLLDLREKLIRSLQKYLLDSKDDLLSKNGPEYVIAAFMRRWEEALSRLENAAEK